MTLPILLTPTSLETAVTSTAASIATALNTTSPIGQAIYALVSTTNCWYAQGVADTVFTNDHTTSINTATAHKLRNGLAVQVSNSGGALPTGLSTATTYWARVIDANTFYLYDTRAHALAGGATGKKTTSDNGTGTQTMTTVATAAAGSTFLPAGLMVPVDGFNGAKVSIIRDSADGAASITQCLMAR